MKLFRIIKSRVYAKFCHATCIIFAYFYDALDFFIETLYVGSPVVLSMVTVKRLRYHTVNLNKSSCNNLLNLTGCSKWLKLIGELQPVKV